MSDDGKGWFAEMQKDVITRQRLGKMLEGMGLAADVYASARNFGSMLAALASQPVAPVAKLAQPQTAQSKHRIYAVSALAFRSTSSTNHVAASHYAHLKTAISREVAEKDELEYMQTLWPTDAGWVGHAVNLYEVSAGFVAMMVELGRAGRIEIERERPAPRMIEIDAPDLEM